MAPRARQAKGKARLNAYEQLLNEDTAKKIEQVEIYIPPGPRLGDVVVEARGLRKAYGDQLLIEDLNFTLPRGGIVGVIRTQRRRQDHTLPDDHRGGKARRRNAAAWRKRSSSVTSIRAVIAQSEQERLGRNHRRLDELLVGNRPVASRAFVSWFNFKGAQQQRKVGTLSGGERNRVHLAKLLQRGSNLLLLDEPTNDLDVDTLRALEEALVNYRRLRRRHQPRPLVPRSHCHAYAGVRGRQQRRLVRGQLSGL
jgi:ATPase subunit of ABC transporter with duplicated ATPase domains